MTSQALSRVPEAAIDAIRPYVARQVWAMVQLQLHTGMRPGEVLQMRGTDLHMTGPAWEYRPEHHKNDYRGQERVVFLGPKAQEIVREFLKPDPDAILFSPADADEERQTARRQARRTPLTPSQAARTQ